MRKKKTMMKKTKTVAAPVAVTMKMKAKRSSQRVRKREERIKETNCLSNQMQRR